VYWINLLLNPCSESLHPTAENPIKKIPPCGVDKCCRFQHEKKNFRKNENGKKKVGQLTYEMLIYSGRS
jgi:hypothetical protein